MADTQRFTDRQVVLLLALRDRPAITADTLRQEFGAGWKSTMRPLEAAELVERPHPFAFALTQAGRDAATFCANGGLAPAHPEGSR